MEVDDSCKVNIKKDYLRHKLGFESKLFIIIKTKLCL